MQKPKKYGERPGEFHVRDLGVMRGEAHVLEQRFECIYT
jgi:hypothetical protein